ncbi:MAG: protein-glutamate O-methyltransferase CheR [Isosphaeraceae bacterium]
MDLTAIQELLRGAIGLDPASAGKGPIAAGVRARMAALRIPLDQLETYTAQLRSSRVELQALVEEVVIPESWFLRDRVPFELLAKRCLAIVTSRPEGQPIRILSLPCARGEEAYSAAICLTESGISGSRLAIKGVDVSHRSIEAAIRGVYSENALRAGDSAFRERYFSRSERGFMLRDSIRSLVRFETGNLIDPQLLDEENGLYDAIFCRNVLIYFDAASRCRALANLDRLLSSDGVLFVGHAEQQALSGLAFRPIEPRGAFAFVRGNPPTTGRSLALLPTLDGKAKAEGARKPEKPTRPAVPERTTLVPKQEERFRPSALEAGPSKTPGPIAIASAPLWIEEATRLAGEGKLAEAQRLCETELNRRGPSAQAFALLGTIKLSLGDRSGAESLLLKAVYLDGNHEEALLGLASLAQRRGDHTAAANYRRRAERVFRGTPPTGNPGGDA